MHQSKQHWRIIARSIGLLIFKDSFDIYINKVGKENVVEMTFEEFIEIFTYNKRPDKLKNALISAGNVTTNKPKKNELGTLLTFKLQNFSNLPFQC